MRRAFFFIVAIVYATTSLASIPRVSALDPAPPIADTLSETRVWASDVLAPFEHPAESELTRALRQGYGDASTTNASGLGRFLSVDPTWQSADLENPQSWNRYAYVRNNPLNATDPDGRVTVVKPEDPTVTLEKTVGTITWAVVTLVLDPGPELGDGELPKNPADRAKYLEQRANEIQDAHRNQVTRDKTTTSIIRAETPDGNSKIVVASSEKKLRPSQRAALKAGEIAAAGEGHAEVTAINHAQAQGWKVKEVAASRPICAPCASAIRKAGAKAVSALTWIFKNAI